MDQQHWLLMPGLQSEEMIVIQTVTKDMTESQKQQFYALYRGKRKEEQTLLILTIIGFFGFAGIQRLVIGETVMGILYFLTVGFCGIGTIIDIVNIKKMASAYNYTQALEAANVVKMMND